MGTQRVCNPERTLANILPLLARCGITRVLDITGLDRIGIPTYNAVRPDGIVLSISNGKGWTRSAAAVSAIMESIEVQHAEYPSTASWRLSVSSAALRSEGLRAIDPRTILSDCLWPRDEFGGIYYSDDVRLDWVESVELISGNKVMIPAGAIYVRTPFTHYFTSNGLASGNTLAEASLHAIFELIERDAIARLVGRTKDSPPSGLRVIDLDGMPAHLRDLAECVTSSGVELFLISVPSAIDVYTFWAIFDCPGEPSFVLSSSVGYGAHSDPVIAASRAITEAAQARLAHIHGAREDLGIDHVNRQLTPAEQAERASVRSRAFDKFRRMPAHSWSQFLVLNPHRAKGLDIEASLAMVLGMLNRSGMDQVFVHDLSKPDLGIAVSKVFIPGLKISVSML
ncbi:MAG TPA: YcaO-like family protein [Allosphingosinicella sp.]|nr:YcaO-like family protein [Allosphingosinicella sp.]